jgi:hypothetical protein
MNEIDLFGPLLCDFETGESLRNATVEELTLSVEAAADDGGVGIIEVDGRHCYIVE